MKRFLLCGLVAAAVSRCAFGYDNHINVQVPPMPPSFAQIDAANSGFKFVNEPGVLFSVSDATLNPLQMVNVQNYTNLGLMVGIPGYTFEYFGNPPPPNDSGGWTPEGGKMASSFVNKTGGLNGGVIDCSGILSGLVLSPGFFLFPEDESLGGKCIIAATNIVHSGQINMDASGLIKLTGKKVDLTGGSLTMASPGQIFFIDTNGVLTTLGQGNAGILDGYWGVGQQTTNNLIDPIQFNTFPPVFSPLHLAQTRQFLPAFEELVLPNAQAFVSDVLTDPSNRWVQVVFLQQTNIDITNSVFFVPGVETAVQWEWQGVDFSTGLRGTNFLYLADDFGEVTNLQLFPDGFSGPNTTFIPANYSFVQGVPFQSTVFPAPAPAPPASSPLNVFDTFAVSNAWSVYEAIFSPSGQTVGDVAGQNVTNQAGRIEITADDSLDLTRTRITALAYTLLRATNHFIGSSNAVILSPNLDIMLRTTNGVLSSTNLVVPNLPTPVGTCGLDSERWTELDPITGITNHFHILIVDSEITPLSPLFIQTLSLAVTNQAAPGTESMFISDRLNVTTSLLLDTVSLTLTTNNVTGGAFSTNGELNLLSPDIFWSFSTPRLLYLTNWGRISAENLMNFAGNMTTLDSDRANATPYEAFVNHGTITNQGTFILANHFENSGIIQESPFGSIDIQVPSVFNTNAILSAPAGNVSITGNNLVISNGFVQAGQSLVLSTTCSLSDGYVFGNQFGLITNSTLPNVVTNGNTWVVGAGVQIPIMPSGPGDLLGTTISNISQGFDSIIEWPANDLGRAPQGYGNNLALGRLILSGTNPSKQFRFIGASSNNALYVDSIELEGSATNTDNTGNLSSIIIQPGMKIYFAQALASGVSIAEKLDGKNGGGFNWVSNYAGVYSSTNINYPDGNTYIFNAALAGSPLLDSDNDNSVNSQDPTPIPTGITFPISISGPTPCADPVSGGTGGTGGGTNSTGGATATGPGELTFPGQAVNSVNYSAFAAQGNYNGLFYETNGINPARSGFFTAKLSAGPAFSAKLEIGAKTYSISGKFDGAGHFAPATPPKGLAPLNVDIQVINNNQIAGHVFGSGWSAVLLADRAAFSVPKAVTDTLLMPCNDTNSTTAAGDAFGTVTISKNGAVQWKGTLPDNTKVTQKSAISKSGIWPLYSSLYHGSGTFMGWMQVATNGGSDIEGSAVWIMLPGKTKSYTSGLTNELDAIGSGSSGSVGFSPARTVLSGVSLGTPLEGNVTITGKTGQSSDKTWKLSINPTTGLFTGSVVHDGEKLSFQGALLEKSGIGGGFFLNADQTQSGKVYFGPAN